jgi:hypothetical protein
MARILREKPDVVHPGSRPVISKLAFRLDARLGDLAGCAPGEHLDGHAERSRLLRQVRYPQRRPKPRKVIAHDAT